MKIKTFLLATLTIMVYIILVRVIFNDWYNKLPIMCSLKDEICLQFPFFLIFGGIVAWILLFIYYLVDKEDSPPKE